MRIAVAAVAAVLALTGTAQAAPGHAEISFLTEGGIWSSRADGSERHLLLGPTSARETVSQPAWSPDGTKLAYVSDIESEDVDEDGPGQLMLFDGTSRTAVTPLRQGVSDASPAWSPDGSALAFVRFTVT